MALEQFQNQVEDSSVEPTVEETPKKSQPSKEDLYQTDTAIRLHKQRQAYDAHLQKLIDSMANRRNLGYDPKLMGLAEGLLTPGKTGSFFEGLGTGMKGYREAGEKQLAQDLETSKLENELRTGQIGQTEKDYAMEQELIGDKYMRDLAAKRMGTPNQTLAVTGAPNARSIISGGGSMGYGSGPNGLITQQDIMMAPKSAQKRIIEDYTRQQNDIKILQEGAKSTEVNVPFLGAQKISVKQQQEIDTIVASPLYQQLPVAEKKKLMAQYYADNGIGEVQYADSGVGGAGKGVPTLETTTEKGLRVEKQKERAKSEIEQDKEDIKFLETKRDNSNTLISNAQGVYSFATNPDTKDTFGILSKGGFLSGLGELIREPLKVGDVSVGVGNVENIVRKTFKSDAEIDAATMAGQYIANLELSFSQALKGQGQVSDNERLIIAKVGPSLSDSPKIAALKAETIIARGTFDQRNAELFTQAQQANPDLTYRAYKNMPQYKSLVEQYNNKLGTLLDKYEMTPKKKESAPAEKQKSSSSLWSKIKEQNKE